MKWEKFTPVQSKTIPAIMESTKDVIVSSGTASGKTEAAFTYSFFNRRRSKDAVEGALYFTLKSSYQ